MTTLLLVRHGATQANEIGYWQGWEDTALTDIGLAQAHAVAQRIAREFAPVAVHSSSLRRAMQTAEVIARAVARPLISHDGLREIHFGQVSGLTLEQFRKGFPGLFEAWTDKTNLDFAWPGGESRRAFFTRVWAAVDGILAAHPGDETVVVVAHGGSLRATLAYLLPDQFTNWWAYDLGNASLTVVDIAAAEPRLRLFNDCAHLSAQ